MRTVQVGSTRAQRSCMDSHRRSRLAVLLRLLGLRYAEACMKKRKNQRSANNANLAFVGVSSRKALFGSPLGRHQSCPTQQGRIARGRFIRWGGVEGCHGEAVTSAKARQSSAPTDAVQPVGQERPTLFLTQRSPELTRGNGDVCWSPSPMHVNCFVRRLHRQPTAR